MPSKNKLKTNEEYNEYFRKYREKNREKVRQYNREYNKIWRKKNGYYNEEKWKKNNRLKINIERVVESAIERGRIKRLPCIICGKKKSLAHHPDYSKPLEVIFLCPIHHKEIHNKIKGRQNKKDK